MKGGSRHKFLRRAGSAARKSIARAVTVLPERYICSLGCAAAALQRGFFRTFTIICLD